VQAIVDRLHNRCNRQSIFAGDLVRRQLLRADGYAVQNLGANAAVHEQLTVVRAGFGFQILVFSALHHTHSLHKSQGSIVAVRTPGVEEERRRTISKPFDATLKDLASINPGDFLADIATPASVPVQLLNVDLSTVTASADIVFGLGDPLEGVVQLDAQAGPDAAKHLDMLVYNALLYRQYRVPVHSVLLLLRREAQLAVQTGSVAYAIWNSLGKMTFDYEVVRLWERPVEALLATGRLSALPLAPLCRLPEELSFEEGMRWVVTRVVERLEQHANPELLRRLLMATFVLTGLRVNREQARSIFQGVRAMRESDTYQAILDEGRAEGRAEGAQRLLLRQGRKRLGEPDEATRHALEGINDLDRLDRISERLLEASTWQELLQTP